MEGFYTYGMYSLVHVSKRLQQHYLANSTL